MDSVDYIKLWHALYTRPRAEKKLAQRLEQRGYTVYCPLQEVRRRWSDRLKKVKIPVLPSYIFVKASAEDRKAVLTDPAAINFVFWLGKPAIISEEEIERLRDFIDDADGNELELLSLNEGDRVRFKSGLWEGQEASVVKSSRGGQRLVLKSLGCALQMSVVATKSKIEIING